MDRGLGNDSSSSEMFLRQLNKTSVKIAKPFRKPLPLPVTAFPNDLPQSLPPPVYNINKDDFRDVVQQLTGSPAHERLPPPPPAARPPSSRLQRIRPPPLAQIGQMTPILPRPLYDSGPSLPPLPSVHMAAESPISAYKRCIQGSASPLAPTESPVSAYLRFFRNSAGSSSGPSQPASGPFPAAVMPFGCVPSPRSPYGMRSSRFIFSPTGLAPQLPLSPTGSPRWRGM